MNKWQELKKMIEYSRQGIISKQIFKSKKIEVGLFCMAKNTKMSEHTSTREVILKVMEGKGVFVLGKEKIPMLPGVIIHMKPNAKHSLTAEKNTSFLLVQIS